MGAILLDYQARVIALHATASQLRLGQTIALAVMCAAIVAVLVLAFLAMTKRTMLPLPATLAPLGIAIYSERLHKRRKSSLLENLRLQTFYEQGIKRLEGRWVGSAPGGEEFSRKGHCYEKDLHVLGEGSLFQLLCTCRTEVGRRRLADYLLQTPALHEAESRQEAIRELRTGSDLREKVALLGEYSFQESRWDTIVEWLDSPVPRTRPTFRILAACTSSFLAALLLAGVAGAAWSSLAPWIGGVLLINGALGLLALFYRRLLLDSLQVIRSVGLEIGILRQGMALLQRQKFHSTLLRQIGGASIDDDPPKQIRKLERLIGALIDRDKPWFYAISRALLVGTQTFLAIEVWRARHRESMRRWLDAWGDFEALLALAHYAHEHPGHAFPRFVRAETALVCNGLGHPLLPEAKCVRNDIAFNEATRFYVISGSNMAGKSTLLRAIGLNAVLAYAGAPVCAEAMALSRFSICASMAIEDSLLKGTSKFLAEIDRLKRALTASAEQRPVLFLIDELLSGTNSKDRRIAAELIIKALLRQGALGAISTHDLALTEIAASADLNGANLHMGSKDDSDPLGFDYRLKPGVANRSNALAIARLAGVLH